MYLDTYNNAHICADYAGVGKRRTCATQIIHVYDMTHTHVVTLAHTHTQTYSQTHGQTHTHGERHKE